MLNNPLLMFLAMPLAAYVIGSTPSGVIIARSKGVDLRKVGSGNVGATNVGRTLGRKWGYICFVLDVLKGLLPVLAAGVLLGTMHKDALPDAPRQAAWLLVGCGAIMGHVLSFWLRFHGGKGVATGLGVVLGLYPYFTLAGLAALGLWVIVTLTTRYVCVGSIVAAIAFVPLVIVFNLARFTQLWPMVTFAAAMCVLIVFLHRGNIRRLMNGTENKIRSKKA